MNMQQMLGEAGRTMSDRDLQDLQLGRQQQKMQSLNPMPSPMMSDNEPRMEDRSPVNQMFSIDSMINNLMQEYDMVVRNQEFDRAQMIADKINMLDVQKSQIQAGMGNTQSIMGESGRTVSNTDRDEISRILDSISI